MGDIWNADALLLFLAFFIPGFIGIQIWGLFVGTEDVDFGKQLPAVIGYSALHYAITGWIILIAPDGPLRLAAAYIVVLVLPAFWPAAILLIREKEKWRSVFSSIPTTFNAMLKPEGTPWDRVLDDRARYIRIRLKSGRFVGGYLGPGSVVSAYPCKRAIYVAKAFSLDQTTGKFLSEIALTGLLIQGAEIETLETIELEEETTN